jgi:hypothetical protein
LGATIKVLDRRVSNGWSFEKIDKPGKHTRWA